MTPQRSKKANPGGYSVGQLAQSFTSSFVMGKRKTLLDSKQIKGYNNQMEFVVLGWIMTQKKQLKEEHFGVTGEF